MNNDKMSNIKNLQLDEKIKNEIKGMVFTKNFRSHTAEEWFVFLVNRLVGYANTLLSVHDGANSFQAEYIRQK